MICDFSRKFHRISVGGVGFKKVVDRWVWLLRSGRNTLEVRAVNKLGARGKPSTFTVNYADVPFGNKDTTTDRR